MIHNLYIDLCTYIDGCVGYKKGSSPTPSPTILSAWRMIGNSIIVDSGSSDIGLPEGYQLCEYLESTGKSYINTGVIPKTTDKISIRVNMLEKKDILEGLFGSDSFRILYTKGDNNAYWRVFDTKNVVRGTSVLNEWVTYTYKEHVLSNDANSNTANSNDINSTAPLCLFTYYNQSSCAHSRISSCKIDGKIDLVPCLDNNGVPCFYDFVSKTALYNSGTGTFDYKLAEEPTTKQILSCGDLGDDGKYHILIKADSRVIDIPLDEPLRKVGDVGDTIDLLKDGYDVDLSNPLNGYFMLADGGWNTNSANYAYEIPVFKGCKVIITGNAEKTTYYGFLKNNTHNKADTIGVRNPMNLGEVAEITIDSDECKYLWIGCAISTGDSRPQSVVISSDTTPNTARVTRKIGNVDMGTLEWTYTRGFFLTTLSDKLSGETPMMIAKYRFVGYVQGNSATPVEDMVLFGSIFSDKQVRIKDSTYTGTSSFKNAMQGVELLYLATPTTSYISVPDIPLAKAYSSANQVPYSEFSHENPNALYIDGEPMTDEEGNEIVMIVGTKTFNID